MIVEKLLLKNLLILNILMTAVFTSCRIKAENLDTVSDRNLAETKLLVVPTPVSSLTPKPAFDINSKIGIVDVDGDETACLRTKNGNLPEKTPISIIIFPYDSPTLVFTATVKNKVDESCACRASESGDKNPGENHFYLLSLNEKLPEFFGFEVGFGVIEPAQSFKIQNNLASLDLNEDGKPEYFRQCSGYEGTHFTIWAGKPLKGRRIWHSFYYVDYDTVADCKKKDWEGTED